MPQKQSEQNILFLYELGHLDACARFFDEHPQVREEGYLIVPLGLEIEYALARDGTPFLSGRTYRPTDTGRYLLSEEWAGELDSQKWQWFQYRGISLSRLFFFSIRHYTLYLLYYATILENLLVRHPAVRRLVVFPSSHALQAVPAKTVSLVREQPLLREQLAVVVACARLIGAQRGIEVVIPQAPVSAKQVRFHRFIFTLQRAFLELGIRIYNAGIGVLRPRGAPRILASDYWRNIEPILSQLPRGELMLFDRGEAFRAGVRNLWRFRIRLFNFNSFSIRGRKKARTETERVFEERWRNLRENGLSAYSSGTFSLRPLLREAFEEIFTHAVPLMLRDIDGAYAMLGALAPDSVFLRASTSLQTHFTILAQVARACGIPSLELQHGLEYLGPGSTSKRHSAEYIAVYGQVVQDEFVALGFPREKIPIVGSPRFDAYKNEISSPGQNRPSGKGLSVLCVGTAVGVESFYDDYDLEDYYRAIARALEKIPGSSVVIKLRPSPARESFYRSAIETIFARVPYTIAQYEPLPELFASADIVVSYYSTFVLEALKFSKPTIAFSVAPVETEMIRFHLTQYAGAGGLLTAYTQDELEEAFRSLAHDVALRDRLAERSKEVLARFHLFDGGASKRIVKLVERLARKQGST